MANTPTREVPTSPSPAPAPAQLSGKGIAPTVKNMRILDVIERTLWSALQAIGAVYLAKGTISITAAEVSVLTALTGGLTAIKTIVTNKISHDSGAREWLEDLVSRATFTFGETLLAALITSAATNLNMPALRAATIGAFGAALAAVKGSLAKSFGNRASAATLPARLTLAPAG